MLHGLSNQIVKKSAHKFIYREDKTMFYSLAMIAKLLASLIFVYLLVFI